jgi:hypothetical protein
VKAVVPTILILYDIGCSEYRARAGRFLEDLIETRGEGGHLDELVFRVA